MFRTIFKTCSFQLTDNIFSDLNFKYDEDFWRDFNVIPLEEELGKLIERISLKIEEIGP